jgi:hypothetical protein
MVFVRIVAGVRHSFPDRKIEWIMGIWAFVWSAKWFFDPADNFVSPTHSWDTLAYLFGQEWIFSGLMMVTGAARLAALTINGTFHDTLYARYSPLVRAATAFFCACCWTLIWFSVMRTNSQGAVTFWAPMAIDLITAYFVVGESADVLRDWRNGSRSGNGR